VIDDRWAGRIAELLVANPELLATSVERIITAEGWLGSYETLVRHLRALRGVRRRRSPLKPIEPLELCLVSLACVGSHEIVSNGGPHALGTFTRQGRCR
jgi:hypothetical protein